MDALYAVKMTYNEELYFHQAAAENAGEAKKQEPASGFDWASFVIVGGLFLMFFLVFGDKPMTDRLILSGVAAAIASAILYAQKKSRRTHIPDARTLQKEELKERAGDLLNSSGLGGTSCTVSFYEEEFEVESPEIHSAYRYDGVYGLKETARYYLIYLNRSRVVPVEKNGFYRGKKDKFRAFLEGKCGKKTLQVKVPS